MKLLAISHSSRLEGAQRSLFELTTALETFGIEPTVIIPEPGPLGEWLTESGIEVVVIRHVPWCHSRSEHRFFVKRMVAVGHRSIVNRVAIREVARDVDLDKISLIYTNTMACPLGGMIAQRWQIPNVWHAREMVETGLDSRFIYGRARSLRFIRDNARVVVCNSRAVANAIEDVVEPNRCSVVYNGPVQTEPSLQEDRSLNDPVRLCVVGAVCAHKNQTEAIRGLKRVLERGVEATLTIQGEDVSGHGDVCRELAQELGVAQKVIWKPFTVDPVEIYSTHDIVLTCCPGEAFGRVAVEAMAAGCPVVGAASGGTLEIIDDGQTGCLYPSGNPDALADSVCKLVKDDQLYRSVRRNAATTVWERFGRQRYVDEMVSIFRKQVESR